MTTWICLSPDDRHAGFNVLEWYQQTHSSELMRGNHSRIVCVKYLMDRLWIVPKERGETPEPQQIGYVNVVPGRNEFGVFDGFGDTVRKFNHHLRVHPLPGKYLLSSNPRPRV
jgi:hypothetical protein